MQCSVPWMNIDSGAASKLGTLLIKFQPKEVDLLDEQFCVIVVKLIQAGGCIEKFHPACEPDWASCSRMDCAITLHPPDNSRHKQFHSRQSLNLWVVAYSIRLLQNFQLIRFANQLGITYWRDDGGAKPVCLFWAKTTYFYFEFLQPQVRIAQAWPWRYTQYAASSPKCFLKNVWLSRHAAEWVYFGSS